MKNKYIYFFIGTTAELIKLAPVIKQFRDREIDFKIITSGQNKILFEEMREYLGSVEVYFAFGEKDEISSVFRFLFWAMKIFFGCLFSLQKEFKGLDKSNSYFIVHGDTVSSLIGALIASIYGLKIVHIEAGLRSFHFFEPFPEEFCRFMVSYLSDIHFCSNEWCVNNLRGRKGVKINTIQNTSIESLWVALQTKRKSEHTEKLKDYFVLVIHRQEHVIFGRKSTKRILEFILTHAPRNLNCALIMNEVTLRFLKSVGLDSDLRKRKGVILIPRLPYMDFIKLLANAECVLTDGGCTQEEAYYLGKPCLLLRNRTERIEGLDENVVLGKGDKRVIKDFLNDYKRYKRGRIYFKKAPSKIIVDYLVE